MYNLYFLFLYMIIKVKIPYKRTKKQRKICPGSDPDLTSW